MALLAKESGGGEMTITPEETYIARCYRIVDLGTQPGNEIYGSKPAHKVMVSWELIGKEDPKMDDGRPYSVHQTYTVSLHEKAKLRKDLEAWRGKKFTTEELQGFDLGNVLGSYCMIQVVHDATGKYANVNAIMSYKGEKPAPVNENVVFDIDEPDMAVFEKFSDNMKAKIMAAPEWKGNSTPPAKQEVTKDNLDEHFGGEPINLDDIPF